MIYSDKLSMQEVYLDIKFDRDFHILTRTAKGEANGLPDMCYAGIVDCVLNRVRKQRAHWGLNAKDVCLADGQYDYWARTNLEFLSYYYIKDIIKIVEQTINDYGKGFDITNGATHYHTLDTMPYWAVGKTPCHNDLGHFYYNNIA